MSKLENENKNEKFEVDENCPGSSSDSNQSPTKEIVLTDFQKARIEERRQKALLLRHRKLIPHPYAKIDKSSPEKSIIKVQGSRFVDTGGGFLLEEDDDAEEQLMKLPLTHQPAPIIEPDRPTCLECQAVFNDSFLFQTFDYAVCDACRDNDDKHALITKTDAKNEYLLKDCDLEKREPPLKFIVKKNPHNVRWGDMKLYLQIQVEERALEVWGSEEKLLEERELREEKKSKAKIKKYNKQVKEAYDEQLGNFTAAVRCRNALYRLSCYLHVRAQPCRPLSFPAPPTYHSLQLEFVQQEGEGVFEEFDTSPPGTTTSRCPRDGGDCGGELTNYLKTVLEVLTWAGDFYTVYIFKALRMSVRSSLYDRTHSSSHEHTFGPETYNEDEDNYSRTCQTCKFEETFEKM